MTLDISLFTFYQFDFAFSLLVHKLVVVYHSFRCRMGWKTEENKQKVRNSMPMGIEIQKSRTGKMKMSVNTRQVARFMNFVRLKSFFKKISLFFNWRMIALQNFVVFCQTLTWISHRYTYIPSLLKLPPHPTTLGWYRAPVWVSWDIQQIPIGYLFYVW